MTLPSFKRIVSAKAGTKRARTSANKPKLRRLVFIGFLQSNISIVSLQESIACASGRGKRQFSDAPGGTKVAVNVLWTRLVLMHFDLNFKRSGTKSEPGAQRPAKGSTTRNTNMSLSNLSLLPVAALPVLILCSLASFDPSPPNLVQH